MSKTAAERFLATDELVGYMLLSVDRADLRTIARTSKWNYCRFNNDGWAVVDGLGNLLAVLDDRLSIRGEGPAVPTCEIPRVTEVDPTRRRRFVRLCPAVIDLNVYANPKRWIQWDKFEHLLDMAPHDRLLFPSLRSATVSIGGTNTISVCPMVRVFSNPRLQCFQVLPDSFRYPISPISNTLEALEVLGRHSEARASGDPGKHNLQRLSIYPEGSLSTDQLAFSRLLAPRLPTLRHLSLSQWCLHQGMLQDLASAHLEHLVITGRFAANVASLGLLNLDIPDGSYATLRTLELKAVPLPDECQILSVPHLLHAVRSLRVAAQPVMDLEATDWDDYSSLSRSISKASNLEKLILVARQGEDDDPFPLTGAMVSNLLSRPLQVLRLYNFLLPGEQGFCRFHWWLDLAHISMTRHDVTEIIK
ncbi:hypothetical protein RhiLY_04922 [Ceratobasidium sp. AG-Ba]|nr:hypothetical protein RhiLY_04922 [Ceratobasidium sp. AG-Ba]